MKLDLAGVLRDAWAMARADSALLLPVTGGFVFLPQLALLLLVPAPPALPADRSDTAAVAAWFEGFVGWAGANGGWLLLGQAVTVLGTLTIAALYLDRERPDLRGAFATALGQWPRALLATLVLSVPIGIGLLLLMLPGLWLMGRLMLVNPALIAERPLGWAAAVRRSLRATRGHGLALTALVALAVLGAQLVAGPFEAPAADQGMVLKAMLSCAAAGVAAAGMLANALFQVCVYRRLATG